VRELRAGKIDEDVIAHKSVFTLLCELMVKYPKSNGVPIDFEGETDENSEIAYFPGCLDFFDCFLDVGVNFHEIGNASIKLLNKIEIKPRLLSLKCCGHDVLWQGRIDLFDALRRYNTEKIEKSGIKTLIISCAECFRTFSMDYDLSCEVIHLSQILEKNLDKLNLEAENRRVTYHDACRLGRHMRVFDAPRNVLGAVKGLESKELNDSREASQCCGVSAWVSCNTEAKVLIVEKLDSAISTGAEILITACPKCYAHLNCIKNEKPPIKKFDIDVIDFAVFLSKLHSNEEKVN
jgi:Fe-S oxidoreductase